MRKTTLARMIALGMISFMAEDAAGNNGSDVIEAPAIEVPEGHILVTESYSFRRFTDTEANRQNRLPEGITEADLEVEEEIDAEGKPTGNKVFRRKTVVANLFVPTPASLGFDFNPEDPESVKQNTVLQAIITSAVVSYGRKLVDEGQEVTPETCNWQLAYTAEYDRLISSGSTGGQTISKELLDELSSDFAKFMKALDKPEEGIKLMVKMIKARFNELSTRKFIVGLPAIRENIETWLVEGCDEKQQEKYADAVQYLVKRIEDAQKPKEVDVGKLF